MKFSDFHSFDRIKQGRIGRRVFWSTVLADFVILLTAFFVPLEVAYQFEADPQGAFMQGWLLSYSVLFFTLTICLTRLARRRLHDAGFTGWYLVLILVPVAGWLCVVWLLMKPPVRDITLYDSI